MVLALLPGNADAMIGGSFEACIDNAHSVVLTEVRKQANGKLAMVVIQTLKGHAPLRRVLEYPVSRDSNGARHLVALDQKGRRVDEDVDDGCTNTVKAENGWVQTQLPFEDKGERLESFKRRMVERSRQERRDETESATLRECLKRTSKRCEGLPQDRRTDIEMAAMEEGLKKQLRKAASACKWFSVMLSAELVVHPNGRTEVSKLDPEPAPDPHDARVDCVRRGLSSARFRLYAGQPVTVRVSEYIFWPATKVP